MTSQVVTVLSRDEAIQWLRDKLVIAAAGLSDVQLAALVSSKSRQHTVAFQPLPPPTFDRDKHALVYLAMDEAIAESGAKIPLYYLDHRLLDRHECEVVTINALEAPHSPKTVLRGNLVRLYPAYDVGDVVLCHDRKTSHDKHRPVLGVLYRKGDTSVRYTVEYGQKDDGGVQTATHLEVDLIRNAIISRSCFSDVSQAVVSSSVTTTHVVDFSRMDVPEDSTWWRVRIPVGVFLGWQLTKSGRDHVVVDFGGVTTFCAPHHLRCVEVDGTTCDPPRYLLVSLKNGNIYVENEFCETMSVLKGSEV